MSTQFIAANGTIPFKPVLVFPLSEVPHLEDTTLYQSFHASGWKSGFITEEIFCDVFSKVGLIFSFSHFLFTCTAAGLYTWC